MRWFDNTWMHVRPMCIMAHRQLLQNVLCVCVSIKCVILLSSSACMSVSVSVSVCLSVSVSYLCPWKDLNGLSRHTPILGGVISTLTVKATSALSFVCEAENTFGK